MSLIQSSLAFALPWYDAGDTPKGYWEEGVVPWRTIFQKGVGYARSYHIVSI